MAAASPINVATGNEPAPPWALDGASTVSGLGSDATSGLSASEVRRRLESVGPNTLRSHRRRSPLTILIGQFRSLIIALLVVACVAALLFGEMLEAMAVAVVIVTNAGIGFVTEIRAVRSMEALRNLGRVATRVVREGTEHHIDAHQLVPGDIVILEGGDVVTADLRILDASKLQADESTLTGESLPVSKQSDAVDPSTVLAERSCMLYKGTSITRGSGKAIVTSTGMDTELGHISSLVESAEESRTPLEERLDRLGRSLIWITLVVAAVAAISGILQGRDMALMIEMGIALAIATIPEGLPVVATVALAAGMRDMARRNALINRLSSVETLGATTLILTDKTGTLTENRMSVVRMEIPGVDSGDVRPGAAPETGTVANELRKHLLELSVLCNNATISGEAETGDPTEVALLRAAEDAGIDVPGLRHAWPEVGEEAFDSSVRMMATWHRGPDHVLVAVKGAPDNVIPHCTHIASPDGPQPMTEDEARRWLERNESLAAEGLRILAIAYRTISGQPDEPYADLTLAGFTAMQDPPRPDVGAAIAACHHAGIEVTMVTGDQAPTAASIAASVGIPSAPVWNGADLETALASDAGTGHVFARVNPEQKLRLIRHFQDRGHIVAMTGDGVNDAPALKSADIGVAMGLRGTQVAQDASDMILKDDAFGTIVSAIERGRVIFENIRRFLVFLLSCNVSEVLIVGLATVGGSPLPILPLQLLFLNFVTDVFPALALGVGKGEENIMDRPPRSPHEEIMTRAQWTDVAIFSSLITVATLGALYISLVHMDVSPGEVVTVSFLTLALAQLFNVFNMRSARSSVLTSDIFRNRWVLLSLLLCVSLLLMALYLPGLSDILSLRPPTKDEWILILSASLFPVVIGQVIIHFRGRALRSTA